MGTKDKTQMKRSEKWCGRVDLFGCELNAEDIVIKQKYKYQHIYTER